MELEEQVCTLEQAKRLKELGCKQDTIFGYYEKFPNLCLDRCDLECNRPVQEARIAAYTVAELGEMLIDLGVTKMPSSIILPKRIDRSIPFKEERGFFHDELNHLQPDDVYGGYTKFFKTEAEARAELLIYFLETIYETNN